MTPQERELVDDLFDRLSKLEGAPRDPQAEQAIRAGLAKAPNALYALTQSVLVQDEALKRADAHIRELEGGEGAPDDGRPRSFLDNMRDALLGGGGRGSVPSVRSGEQPMGTPPQNRPWGRSAPPSDQAPYPQQPYPQQPYPQQPGYGPGGGMFGGGSFLGTAAAAAAGMVGGGLLLGGIRSMLGGGAGHQGAFSGTFNQIADNPAGAPSPWGNNAGAGGDLANQAGLNDIGGGGRQAAGGDSGGGLQSLFGGGDNSAGSDDAGSNDGGGGSDGGSDSA